MPDEPTATTEAPEAPRPSRARRVLTVLRHAWTTVVFDVGAPLAIYLGLTAAGVAPIPALLLAGAPPLVGVVVTVIRERRVNGIGAIVLASIGVGLLLPLLGGDARDVVARDAYPNAALGLAMVVSLLLGRRPLLYYLLRLPGEDLIPGVRESFDEQWQANARFRRVMRRTSAIWGAVLLTESAIRLWAAHHLPIAVTLTAFNVEGVVVWFVLIGIFIWEFNRAKSRSLVDRALDITEAEESADLAKAPGPPAGA